MNKFLRPRLICDDDNLPLEFIDVLRMVVGDSGQERIYDLVMGIALLT